MSSSCLACDPVCSCLRQAILQDWPSDVCDSVLLLHPFFQFQGELVLQGKLIFHGSCLVVSQQFEERIYLWPCHIEVVLAVGDAYVDLVNVCSGME